MKQFPVTHAQGVTIHKFQGVTTDNLQLCFDSKLKVHGLAYVGLSRCRTERGNSLISAMTVKDFKVDEDVQIENMRLEEKGFKFHLQFPINVQRKLKFLFHNVQPVLPDFKQIVNNVKCQNCSFLIITETLLTFADSIDDFKLEGYSIQPYKFPQSTSVRPSAGMCVYISNDITSDCLHISSCILHSMQFLEKNNRFDETQNEDPCRS